LTTQENMSVSEDGVKEQKTKEEIQVCWIDWITLKEKLRKHGVTG